MYDVSGAHCSIAFDALKRVIWLAKLAENGWSMTLTSQQEQRLLDATDMLIVDGHTSHFNYDLLSYAKENKIIVLQWAKKPSHQRSNFTCQANCCSDNKGKTVGNLTNKGKYTVLCHTKVQKFSQFHCFNIYFTIWYPRWDSFVASTWFGPFWPLSQPLSFWAYSQSDFYIPPLVFFPIPSAPCPKAHVYQQEGPHMHWAATWGVAKDVQ